MRRLDRLIPPSINRRIDPNGGTMTQARAAIIGAIIAAVGGILAALILIAPGSDAGNSNECAAQNQSSVNCEISDK